MKDVNCLEINSFLFEFFLADYVDCLMNTTFSIASVSHEWWRHPAVHWGTTSTLQRVPQTRQGCSGAELIEPFQSLSKPVQFSLGKAVLILITLQDGMSTLTSLPTPSDKLCNVFV